VLADYKEGIPFQNPEAADCWLEFRDLLQQFMTYIIAAARFEPKLFRNPTYIAFSFVFLFSSILCLINQPMS